MRTEAIAGLQSSLALWQLETDSELVFVGDAGTTEAGRPARRRGIELSNRYTPRPWLLIDADLAKESARLQSLQIRQQLGTQALSIANQAPQTLLSLFR